MTGLELVSQLRTQGANVPVLLVTGSLSPAIAARATQLGIEKVLEKPLAEDDLLSFVTAHR
jgi:CheY-like chemotaxis protein